MSLEIVSKIPISSTFVPSFFEAIIDKKIANVALNIFEKIADFILSWIYCPYHYLHLAKRERVHHFQDGTPLYDCTKEGGLSIKNDEGNGSIAYWGLKVSFPRVYNIATRFSRENKTAYVAVRECNVNGTGGIQVVEQEMSDSGEMIPAAKLWDINVSRIHRFPNEDSFEATISPIFTPPRRLPKSRLDL